MSYLKTLTDADAAMRAAGAGPCMHIRVGFSMAKEITEKADAYDELCAQIEWSASDSAAAVQQGWDMFEVSADRTYFAIQRCDESGAFADDEEAVFFVYRQALQGSELHRRAIKYTLQQAAKGDS